jgi:copper chaperone
MSCGHCRAAIVDEVSALAGVTTVAVDLEDKRVSVRGAGLDDNVVRAAIEAAGYEVER